MSVLLGSEFGGHAGEGPARHYPKNALDVRIVTEQRSVGLLGEHSDASRWMTVPDGTEKGSGEEHVADRAEAHG
jgi:hypothetical protein